jgi:hypothetical protein
MTPEQQRLMLGRRVQLPPWDGTWWKGDRYGKVTGFSRDGTSFYVKTDLAGATRRYAVELIGTDNAASFV